MTISQGAFAAHPAGPEIVAGLDPLLAVRMNAHGTRLNALQTGFGGLGGQWAPKRGPCDPGVFWSELREGLRAEVGYFAFVHWND